MKIEIEFDSTYEAHLTIDGRKLNLNAIPIKGVWRIDGLAHNEEIETIGGMVASKLMSPLIDILQGHSPDEPNPQGDSWGTWERLTESAADEIYDAIGI